MLDLALLRDGGRFSTEAGPPRLALIHHGFRTTQLEILDSGRPRFSPRYPSLGLLNLARSLQVDSERGLLPHEPEFRYFDEDCFDDDEDLANAVAVWLRPAQARYVLAGLYTLAVERTAAFLGRFDPAEHCIVVGGAHATVAPRTDFAHVAVRGEGGAALRHIVTKLLDPDFGEGRDARGICFVRDGEEQMSGAAYDNSLAVLPAPAFAFELSQSRSNMIERPQERWWKATGSRPQIYICTQSCRARCTFCSTYLIHGRAVSRPVDLVSADLDYILDEFGHDSIQFHDDDILQHTEFDRLMDLLASKGATWSCNARSEFITRERAEQMFAAGCRRIFLGLESLDQQSLDYYHKATTVEMNQEAVRLLDAVGIGVVAGYIIGAPHDTLDSALADLDRLMDLPIYFLSAAILTPDIGTVEYLRARKEIPALRLLGDDGGKFNLKPRPDLFGTAPPYGFPTVSRALSKDDLNEVYELANCAFFLRAPTLERILRLTSPDHTAEIRAWYAWMEERAAKLSASARLEPVRARARAFVDTPLAV